MKYMKKITGLLIKSVQDDSIMNNDYKLNNVYESIFVEPDISQYTLK